MANNLQSVSIQAGNAAAARADYRAVAALSVAQLISWGSIYYGFSLFILPMERELGWSRNAMNGALSLGLLVAGLCAYPVGRWIDLHGGRLVMSLGSLLAALLFFAWSQATSLPMLFAVWVGLGVAMGATLYDPVFAVITRRYPASFRTKIIALTLVGGFASTVFIPLTQYIVDEVGWRSALLLLGLVNLLICLPIHFQVLREPAAKGAADALAPQNAATTATGMHIDRKAQEAPSRDAVSRDAVSKAVRHPTFWALLVCFTCYYATFAAMTFHLVPLLVERHVATGLIVMLMASIGPAQVLARIILLSLGARLHTARAGQIVVVTFSVSIAMLMMFPASTPMLLLAILLYGGANGMLTIIRGTAVPDLLWREAYGAINGLIAFPSNMAKAVGPLGAALIWSATGNYRALLWTVFLVSIVSAVSFRIAAVQARR